MKKNRILARMTKSAEKYHVTMAIDLIADKLPELIELIEDAIYEANEYDHEIDCRDAAAQLQDLLDRMNKEKNLVEEISRGIEL